ncbi:MAG: hypothetical protein KatS3mg043_1622 [Rhodothermaceae bacterium]|nr:MAG: hypothetical protein KatS3mg043_1622 [Rhodothermaceae bacterium]
MFSCLLHRRLLALLSLCLFAGAARAQSADDILRQMVEAYEARMAGIDDYTVVTEQFTTYYKKVERDGRRSYDAYTELNVEGLPAMGALNEDDPMMNDPRVFLANMAGYGERVGQAAIDGRPVHHLRFEEFPPDALHADPATTPKRLDLYVDAEHLVPVKMHMWMEHRQDGAPREVEAEMRFEDYRETKGLLHPFRTTMRLSGLQADISEKELAEARKGMAELEKQLAGMPEAQADRMRKMLEPQLKKLEEILESGTLTMTFVVRELKVNTGVPGQHFQKRN